MVTFYLLVVCLFVWRRNNSRLSSGFFFFLYYLKFLLLEPLISVASRVYSLFSFTSLYLFHSLLSLSLFILRYLFLSLFQFFYFLFLAKGITILYWLFCFIFKHSIFKRFAIFFSFSNLFVSFALDAFSVWTYFRQSFDIRSIELSPFSLIFFFLSYCCSFDFVFLSSSPSFIPNHSILYSFLSFFIISFTLPSKSFSLSLFLLFYGLYIFLSSFFFYIIFVLFPKFIFTFFIFFLVYFFLPLF